MGHCGYYCRFICMYLDAAQPLYALLIVFEWIDKCEEAFQKLKNALVLAPILRAPKWDEVFHVHIDASAFLLDVYWPNLVKKIWIFQFLIQVAR